MVPPILGCGPGDRLRLAIVGVGRMGRRHLRTWQSIAGVAVVALVDRDDRAATQAQGVPFFRDCRALYGHIDAAVIATPAAEHAGCACRC